MIHHSPIPRVMCVLCVGLLMQGCVPNPLMDAEKEKAALSMPEDFPGQEKKDGTDKKDEAVKPPEKSSANDSWQLFYTDPNLRGLIETALKNNQELHIMEQEIAIANNEVMARRGEYLPRMGVGAGYELERVGEHTSQGVSDERHDLPKQLRNHEAGFYATWEVDIWKRLRNAKQSAYYEYLATIEGKKFMVTNLVAEIANTYYELMALDRQLDIVKQYINTLEQGHKIVEYQQQAARANSLAVKRFAAEVLKNKSRRYTIEQQIIVTENKLNALVGRFPQPVERSSKSFTSMTPNALKSGVPSELMENRPDIQQSVLDMEAAELDVSVAKARFYPSLSIDAGIGLQAFNSKYFTDTPESMFYNVATNLTAPLINRLAIEADYQSANSAQLQSIYHYQQTIINAYVEVVNQLNAIKNMEQIYGIKSQQVATLKESIDISSELFKAARIDYLEALLTQRDALEAQMDLMEVKQQQLSAYVNLYKALGGGWREEAVAPAQNDVQAAQ